MDAWTHKASCVLWHLDCCQHWPEGTEAAAFLSSSCIVLILVLWWTHPHHNPITQLHTSKHIEPKTKKVSNPETRRPKNCPCKAHPNRESYCSVRQWLAGGVDSVPMIMVVVLWRWGWWLVELELKLRDVWSTNIIRDGFKNLCWPTCLSPMTFA